MAVRIKNIAALIVMPLLALPLGGCLGGADIGQVDIAQRVKALVENQNSCFTCMMVNFLFDFIKSLIDQGIEKISPPALGLLGVLYLVWLTVHILKGVGELAVGGNDLGEKFFPDFVIRTACVGLAAILIGSSSAVMWLLDNTVFYIIRAFVDLSITVVNSSMGGSVIDKLGIAFPSCQYSSGSGIESLQGSMLCLINFMHQLFMSGVGFALSMFFSGSLLVQLGGVVLLLIFITYALAFPFYIMDAVVRMSFFLVMTPLLIVSWVFPYSRSYTKKAFDSFAGTGVQLAFITMFMCFTAMVLYSYLTNNVGILDPAVLSGIDQGVVDKTVVLQEAEVGGVTLESQALLVLIFVSYYLFKASGKVSDMASEFIGTMGSSIFTQMINTAVGAAKSMLMKTALGPMADAVKGIGKAISKIVSGDRGKSGDQPKAT